MAFVAVRGFAPEQFVARLFLGRELGLPSHYIVILGRERVHFSRTLEGSDRFCDSIEGSLCNSTVDGSEMQRQRVNIRSRAWLIAHLLCIRRPLDRKCLRSPKAFRHGTVRALGYSIHHTRRVDQTHLDWIQRRTLCLLGECAVQAQPSGAHVPKLATDKITLFKIVMKDG